MAFDEPSSSLAHLQARQRLAWGAGLHARLGAASSVLRVGALLHARIGRRPPILHPHHSSDDEQLDARTSTVKGAVRGDTRGVEAWHVARAARSLHSLPLCSSVEGDNNESRVYRWIVDQLAARMTGWHAKFSGVPSCAHFFNKTSFMHEMEEVLLPLRVLVAMQGASWPQLQDELTQEPPVEAEPEPDPQPEPIIVVDLCAGKGFLPMCLAHGAVVHGSDRAQAGNSCVQVSRVLLLEKARVNWAHLRDSPSWKGAPAVDIWGPPREKLNIFDESLVGRLAELPGRLLLVGIHLCRRLSTRAIEIFNLLGPRKTAGLILAPCCLPTASGIIEIAALARTASAANEAVDSGAVSVTSPSYVLWDNPVSRAWSAPGAVHCWNCGGTGHLKDVCPLPKSGLTKGQIRRRRKFANRRIAVSVDTERIVTSARPFQAWVNALFEGVDCPADEKKVTVLPCAASDTRPEHDDGQACASGEDRQTQQLQRKMTWLVAIRGHKLETAMPWLCRR